MHVGCDTMPNPGDILKVGHWIYDGTVLCRVEIQFSNIRHGSADYEDPPEWREDQPGEWFVVSYAPPTNPDICPPEWKWTPGHPTFEEAVVYAERILRDCNLKWIE
jgi:hypothetical protein